MRPVTVAALVTAGLSVAAGGCRGSDEPADRPAPDRAAKRACLPSAGGGARVDPAPEGTPSRVRLGPGMELERSPKTVAAAAHGKRLLVVGAVRGQDCEPLAGATVHAWQTNGDGRYGPGAGEDMRCCYLQGVALTDARGRYTLVTIVPGGYAGGPAHIHVEVGHPDADGVLTEMLLEEVPLGPVGAGRLRAEFDVVLRTS